MPVPILEADELRPSYASDWLNTCTAPLREQLSVAVGTVRFLVLGGEPLAG